MKFFNQKFLDKHEKGINIALIISIFVFFASVIFLCIAIFHTKDNDTPLTYYISPPEAPEGAVQLEQYEVIIPAIGNDPNNVTFAFDQELSSGKPAPVISMNYRVEVESSK